MNNEVKKSLDDAAGAGTSDKVEGNTKEAVGRLKEAAGALTGDNSLRSEGVGEQMEGKLQHTLGEVKKGAEELLDKAKNALHKD